MPPDLENCQGAGGTNTGSEQRVEADAGVLAPVDDDEDYDDLYNDDFQDEEDDDAAEEQY